METKGSRKSIVVVIPESSPMPEHFINLDLPPVKRWVEIGRLYKRKVHNTAQELLKIIPEHVHNLVNAFENLLDSIFHPPYADELRGLAETLQMPLGELVVINLSFDLMSNCISIIAQTSDGKLLHGRNVDLPYEFSPIAPLVRSLAFNAHFQSGGKTLYTGVILAGSVGLFTGQKHNSFTISINQRRSDDIWTKILVLLLKSPGSEISLAIRDALADRDINYQGVLNRMMYIPMLASSYVIIGGTKPGEGVVITRDRKGSVRPIRNGVWKLDVSVGRWYLVQTNNDHWTRPPHVEPMFSKANFSYEREIVAKKEMEKYGQANLSPQSLIDTLSKDPVLNADTIYTTIMSAAYPSLYKSWTRDKQ